jgi:hypothetical protein
MCPVRTRTPPPPTPGVFEKEFGIAGKQRTCVFGECKRVRKSVIRKGIDEKPFACLKVSRLNVE